MPNDTGLLELRSMPHTDVELAAASYLAGFTGHTRSNYATDLRMFFAWCAGNQLHPFEARRPHLELFVRWLQEVKQYKPATVGRRFSTIAGFYRCATIDNRPGYSCTHRSASR